MSEIVKIRHIEAKPGEKVHGFIDIAETASTQIQIPVIIVNGSTPGPKLCITAAVHCTEYEGVEAAIRTYQEANPADLNGTLIICPVINTPGFQHGTLYVNPLDGKNMNNVYPGNPNGTISEKMIHVVLNEIIRPCDWRIDLHGGEPIEEPGQFVIYATGVGQKDVEEKSIEMARYFLTDLVHEIPGGAIGTSSSEVIRAGIPSIASEAGALGAYREDDIQFHLRGIKNVMKWLGMLPKEGPPEPPKKNLQIMIGAPTIRVAHGGIFYSFLDPGDWFKKGDIIAEIKDMFGNVIEQIIAPEDGMTSLVFRKRVKIAGDSAFHYLKPKSE